MSGITGIEVGAPFAPYLSTVSPMAAFQLSSLVTSSFTKWPDEPSLSAIALPRSSAIDRGADHDLIGAQMDAKEGVDECQEHPREDRDQQAEEPRIGDVGAPDAEEGAHQHVALEADVHDSAPLREHAADRGERQRRRVTERRSQQRRPDDDVVQVAGARARRGRAEQDPHDAGDDCPPTDAPGAASGRSDPGRDGDDADEDRPQHRPRRERRERKPERQQAQTNSGDADPLRLREPGAARAITPATSVSARTAPVASPARDRARGRPPPRTGGRAPGSSESGWMQARAGRHSGRGCASRCR